MQEKKSLNNNECPNFARYFLPLIDGIAVDVMKLTVSDFKMSNEIMNNHFHESWSVSMVEIRSESVA